MIESFKLPNITPETLTGSICSFSDEYGNLPLKSCVSQISGYQEGSGTPSPSNPRNLVSFSSASLGKCDNNTASLWTIDNSFNGDVNWNQLVNKTSYVSSKTINGLTITNNYDGTLTINGTTETSDYVDLTSMSNSYHNIIQGRKYLFLSPEKSSGTTILWGPTVLTGYKQFNGSAIFPAVGTGSAYTLGRITHDAGYKYDNYKYYLMMCDLTSLFGNNIADYLYTLEQQTTGAGVALFKALYPNDYYPYNAGTKQLVGDTLATFTFGQSIYQGSIDWKRGVVVATWGYIASYNGETLTGEWLCNKAPYEVGTTPPTGSQVAYELAAPIEIPLGGINLLTQQGQNNIYCDTGDTTVEWLKVN